MTAVLYEGCWVEVFSLLVSCIKQLNDILNIQELLCCKGINCLCVKPAFPKAGVCPNDGVA